ncbi:Uu.00g015150.m01.CDS01 [Anthostomella pinea]|uniref:non-specific serine/threonine protein kinase n=1 Tax=Anthostomella pinea TaxID=933095 RepID=A0AAI8VYH2_9PEZI|nr:Uu.00g015150.m01.CDS01 [Anthostomella pinea]
MESNDDSQATQQATQNALDPRRIGKQNSGFSDEDISDIVCLLYPNSEAASREVHRIAVSPESSRHTVGRYSADAINSDLYREDDVKEFGRTRGIGDHAIVLRLSSAVKDPRLGFTFGRNRSRCDICFGNDPARRLSNIHFRIFVNRHGSVLLEDQSTNGTVVDSTLLRKKQAKSQTSSGPTKRILESGASIKIIMHETTADLVFLARIPRRDGDHEEAYLRKLAAYQLRLRGDDDDLNKTIGPGPGGHVNLFAPRRNGKPHDSPMETTQELQEPFQRLPREWRGGEKYARVGQIGKGAFAIVHKVTSKYDGSPYAAKELDKRKFMKNGVLDQKVENEMRIMQRIQHANIVQYIEHFDWDAHQFIIIMEYVPGGDLGRFISENGPIAEGHVKIISEQLIDALGYLHDQKITHRDVKPDNILIQSTNPLVVKLTDFGLSKMIETEQTFLKTFCGTLLYCAPEVYTEFSSYDDNGRRTNRNIPRAANKERYDHAVDIWSLGGVLFYTLAGSPPFPVKNGVTYTELLDHIVKIPVNMTPLTEMNVSQSGIHFLSRMIHVRPETRATISELQAHPWLRSVTQSFHQISDDELGQSASQLSLDDRQAAQSLLAGASSLQEPEPDYSIEYESEKENYTFGQPQPNRLFGEVSAIGSSEVMPEGRLNLPISGTDFGETDILEPDEILDSFDESEEFSTPRQKVQRDNGLLSDRRVASNDNSRSALLGIGSQSLGGASSILENLNMKSVANGNARLSSSVVSDFNSSKRKPAYDTSDEYESASANTKPSIKRLKSQDDVDFLDEEEDEFSLFASVPPMAQNETGRQIAYPLPKTTFWDSSDKDTWHLDYPEMTNLQYHAFEVAAERRNEEFGPGKSLLWDFAMRHFPPTHQRQASEMARPLELRPAGLRRDNRALSETSDWELPPTAPPPAVDDESESLPDTLPPENQLPPALQAVQLPKTVVGKFESAPGSLVAGVSIFLKDPVMSWGREPSNTVVYQPAREVKVPKNAFRLVLWRDGYNASFGEFRPWEPARSATSRTMRASPEPESFAFYISTKATNGLRINNKPLQANEPKDGTAPCRYWMKLHHGDTIAFWGNDDVHAQAKLIFECNWGGSSTPRPVDEPPSYVPETQARKLDRLWPKAVKSLSHDRIKVEAHTDQETRMRFMMKEQERSRIFEQKRAEAVRVLALHNTYRGSPASAPPLVSRNVPRFRQTSPAGYVVDVSD